MKFAAVYALLEYLEDALIYVFDSIHAFNIIMSTHVNLITVL